MRKLLSVFGLLLLLSTAGCLSLDERITATLEDYDPLVDGDIPDFAVIEDDDASGQQYHDYLHQPGRNLGNLCVEDLSTIDLQPSAPSSYSDATGRYTAILTLTRPDRPYGYILIGNNHLGAPEYYQQIQDLVDDPSINIVIWETARGDDNTYWRDQAIEEGQGRVSLYELSFYHGESAPDHQRYYVFDVTVSQLGELQTLGRRMESDLIFRNLHARYRIYQERLDAFMAGDATVDLVNIPDLLARDDTSGDIIYLQTLVQICGRNPLYQRGLEVLGAPRSGHTAIVIGADHLPDLVRRIEGWGYDVTATLFLRHSDPLPPPPEE